MAELLEQSVAPDTIKASVNYLLYTGEMPFTYSGGPGSTEVRRGGQLDPREIPIHNGRPHAAEFMLDREGFRFIRHDTEMRDFLDEEEVRRVYYPEMEALVKAESGASQVLIFDYTPRTADEDDREARKIRERVHSLHHGHT